MGVPIYTIIQTSTYLMIRNNPSDYIDTYEPPQSIVGRAKLTKGGADTLMMFSIFSTDLKALAELIKIGNDPKAQNKAGFSALMFASAYNTPEVINFLLEQGAELEITEYLSEGNALHIASRLNPKPEVFEALVEAGLDIESKDKDGNTPLLIASQFNQNLQVVEKLIVLGANIEVMNSEGKSAYQYAHDRVDRKRGLPFGQFEFISKDYEQSVLTKLRP